MIVSDINNKEVELNDNYLDVYKAVLVAGNSQIHVEGLSANQVKWYIASLFQKGVIERPVVSLDDTKEDTPSKMRLFDKTDWLTFGGAESNEESPALIREISNRYVVVVDLRGLTIMEYDDDYVNSKETTIELPYAAARRIANAMGDNIEMIDPEFQLTNQPGV